MDRDARDDLSRLEDDVRQTRRRMRATTAALRPRLRSAFHSALPGPIARRLDRPRPAALAYGGNRPANLPVEKKRGSSVPLAVGAAMGLAVLIPRMIRRGPPRD